MRRLVPLLLLLAACGGDSAASTTTTAATAGPFPADAFAYAASSDLAIGSERLLVAVSDGVGTRLPSPQLPVTITVWPEERAADTQSATAGFIWAIPDVSGLYKATFEFDVAGLWVVSVQPETGPALPEFLIDVQESPATIAVGEAAPLSATPTSAEFPLEEITSATDPDPALYEMSIATAVTSGRPTVIAFSTPKFCQTMICGPTLDRVIEAKEQFPEVNFIHVEVFTNLADPDNLSVVPAVVEWGLPTEPWVFVVDAAGVVVARFEGVVEAAEIADALTG